MVTSKSKIKSFERDESIKAQREANKVEAARQEKERKEQARLIKQAETADKNGKTEKANALLEQAVDVTVAPTPVPARVTKKLIWKVRVKNPLMACKSISEGLAPTSLVVFQGAALNAFAKNHDKDEQIPGFEFYQDVASRI